FFFQAEDGIRDFHVTGVQTCALPISLMRERALGRLDAIRVVAVDAAIVVIVDTVVAKLACPHGADHEAMLELRHETLPIDDDAEIGRASCRERAESREVDGA